MIPLEYRLRRPVQLEPARSGVWRVVCEEPLAVLTVNDAAARLVEKTRGGAIVSELAAELRLQEERVLTFCEYLRGRGLLDVRRAPVDRDFSPPNVTIVIPTLERADQLDECLRALSLLDYPRERVEMIVVDDGSLDAAGVARMARRHGAHLLVNDYNRGPAYSRNRAAAEANGDVLALIDSDCVAGSSWLRDLVPYFGWPQLGAVGGRTLGYYTHSSLDRYEEVASPLDIGRHLIVKGAGTDTFYVPTCNLLVRRAAYLALSGLREDLLVGEDVDFCWRLRASGTYLLYAPEGTVRHKHRNDLAAMLRRRAHYGTSEPVLHALHRDKRKRFPLAPAPLATVGVVSAALLFRDPRLLLLGLAPTLWDGLRRRSRARRAGLDVSEEAIWKAVGRTHLSLLFFAYFHLTRYYLGPLTLAGCGVRGFWWLEAVAVLYAAAVDYTTRKPRLPFPTYLAYYVAEHAAYQGGVMAGCLRTRSLRSYRPVFERSRALGDRSLEAVVG
jgi:mycofactocin system glycosyltransferase